MKANCDNWEQPDTFVYLHNLRSLSLAPSSKFGPGT